MKPLHALRIEFNSTFHQTSAELLARPYGDNSWRLTKRQMRKADRTLCPSPECTCGGLGRSEVARPTGVVLLLDRNQDGGATVTLEAKS